ncbi:MAG: 50S ribosomal protein L28 [Candidatus Margulisbacteria bacterium]|nr:50S ribosomal protein L28 [Candidatus Margulisiibacteriota bacterium]MBU1021496.1 50S ribosomal protein L28 [Candidatus Margulisiibacteriota bacterium]MBU1728581.1 50S ribosomal protein L28 [Candidatus Margulisiibacteriota bacterium]MBU1955840.1 50S ribosomal protein L28 [Candidatus Margulisiibacteriota bacterium]
MSRKCYVCGKVSGVGNKVSHSNRKSKRRWHANLQAIRTKIAGKIKRIMVCTKCLKKGKVKKAI